MFNIDDVVQHRKTGKVGKIIGYGYQIANFSYVLTLKVEVSKNIPFQLIVEDITNEWCYWQGNTHRLFAQNLLFYPTAA